MNYGRVAAIANVDRLIVEDWYCMSESSWDHTIDVLVVSSGIGAAVAALTAHDEGARTLLIERSGRYGGSSAMSAGGLWIPNNRLMGELDIDDSPGTGKPSGLLRQKSNPP